MISIRQIFTEEMLKNFNEGAEFLDIEYIAYYDTVFTLKELTKSIYFGSFYWHFSALLTDINLYKINHILQDPPEFTNSIFVNEIADIELIKQFYTDEDLKLISNNKLLVLLNHFDLLMGLTDFNKKYYHLLRIAAQMAIVEISNELDERGITLPSC